MVKSNNQAFAKLNSKTANNHQTCLGKPWGTGATVRGPSRVCLRTVISGPIRVSNWAGKWDVNIDPLDSDLSFILVHKARLKSEILNRIQDLKAQGGIKMYAEVYRWFTETSGLGVMWQAANLMNPKVAAKESDVAEAIEQ